LEIEGEIGKIGGFFAFQAILSFAKMALGVAKMRLGVEKSTLADAKSVLAIAKIALVGTQELRGDSRA